MNPSLVGLEARCASFLREIADGFRKPRVTRRRRSRVIGVGEHDTFPVAVRRTGARILRRLRQAGARANAMHGPPMTATRMDERFATSRWLVAPTAFPPSGPGHFGGNRPGRARFGMPLRPFAWPSTEESGARHAPNTARIPPI